jgi:hypothetical protein
LLRDLLKMHQGTTKLRQRARLSVFWPNMDAEIVSLAGACEECTSRLPSHPPEPLQPHEAASRPFEQIHADLCEINGRHFLIQVDSFSGWPHVVYYSRRPHHLQESYQRCPGAVHQRRSAHQILVRRWPSIPFSGIQAISKRMGSVTWSVVPSFSSV